jgi:translation initiation factor eIF-2B subunit epsilon
LKDLSVGKDQGDDSDSASEIGDLSDTDSEMGSIGDAWHPEQSQMLAAKKVEEFKRELEQSISRAFAEQHSVDLAALEITGLRMSANGSYDVVREVIVPAIINQVDLSKPMPSIRAVMKKWAPLIVKVTHGKDDQVHVLYILQVILNSWMSSYHLIVLLIFLVYLIYFFKDVLR